MALGAQPRKGVRRRLPWGGALVAGPSMAPALHAGDHVLVRWAAPARVRDVVVARRPDRPDLLVVKRAVRREPAGWWLAGDNPFGSDDSAVFGPVPDDAVLGRVVMRYWPLRLPGRRSALRGRAGQ